MIKLCIDTTTGLLIVGMFFLSRHLRQIMPGPPPQAIKFSTVADAVNSKASGAATALSGLFGSKAHAPAPAVAAQASSLSSTSSMSSTLETPAAPVVASSATPASSAPLAMSVEVPGSSNNAEQNMAGWISNTPKSEKSPVNTDAAAPVPANPEKSRFGSSTITLASSPATAAPQPASIESQPAAKPGLGDSFMAVLSPSASAETIQPVMQPTKKADQTATVPAARQALKAQAPVHHEPAPLTDDQKLLKAAQTGFEYVMGMANNNRDIYGFSSNDKLEEAKLGDPIRVSTVMESDRKSYQAGQSLKQILKPTNEWIFPVTLNNRVRFMVPVKRIDGEYVAGTSSRSLAIVYEKIQDRWPASQGYHPQLVVYANIADYYFTVPELPEPNLTDTGEMFEFNPTLSPATVIFASWR